MKAGHFAGSLLTLSAGTFGAPLLGESPPARDPGSWIGREAPMNEALSSSGAEHCN